MTTEAKSYAPNDIRIYDDVADAWWSGDVAWVRTLHNMVAGRLRYFDRMADWRSADVLDVGCAGGFMSEALAERGARVIGVDPAAKAIDAARRQATASGSGAEYLVGVGEALPFPDGAFDYVVCVDVLEHVDSLDQTISEIARVLRPGGTFFFDTINRNLLSRFVVVRMAERILRLLPRGAHDPKLFITPRELRSSLERSGFQPGRFTGLGPTGLNRRFDFTFGRLPSQAIIYMGSAGKPANAAP